MDDNYEVNNLLDDAYDLSNNKKTWFSDVDGLGIHSDDDWYKISVAENFEHLIVDFKLIENYGEIDLDVYDKEENLIASASSYSLKDKSLQIDTILPASGIYYLKINSWNNPTDNVYDLQWNTIEIIDDKYESNNQQEDAYDLSKDKKTWLSDLEGTAIHYDRDWYKISVKKGFEKLAIDFDFTNNKDKDLALSIYDENGNDIGYSFVGDYQEYSRKIAAIVPTAGDYYLMVDSFDFFNSSEPTGVTYDLKWDSLEVIDDQYESNNKQEDAYDLSKDKNTWLSNLKGQGVLYDEDWYQISVEKGFEHLVVDLQTADADASIDLELYDRDGNKIDTSYFGNLSNVVPSAGTYYLKLSSYNPLNYLGANYDLRWNTLKFVEDNYEPNNTLDDAYDLTNYPQTWLKDIDGLGIHEGEDWYKISVEEGFEHLVVDFDGSIEVYDKNGDLVASDFITYGISSYIDFDGIDTILPSAGTYFLKIDSNSGETYDLRWNSLNVTDNYESNDTLDEAYDLTNYKQTWLKDIDGIGIQSDDDWYKIAIAEGFEHLIVDLRFTNEYEADYGHGGYWTYGDINLEIYDETGNSVTGSYTVTDNEYIDTILPTAGTYYLKVNSSEPTGDTYDLWWNSLEVVDDNYEPNNTLDDAYDLTNYQQTWLKDIEGVGIRGDDDWYKVSVDSGFENLIVELQFTHTEGNIKLEIYDQNGDLVTSSGDRYNRNRYITTTVPTAGTYYLKVSSDNNDTGYDYDLRWRSRSTQGIQGVGDFNGDGQADILRRDDMTGENSVWLIDDLEISETITLDPIPYSEWGVRSIDDFNGDGQADILWRNSKVGKNSVWLMDDTTRIESVSLSDLPYPEWDIKGTGDFNGDGKTDILWRNEVTGVNKVWLMNGTTRILTFDDFSLPSVKNLDWDIKGTGDFNGDEKPDLLWRNEVTGVNKVWLMDGTTRIESISLDTVANTDWDLKGAGDFDDDGMTDLLWSNDCTGKNSIWLMDGTTRTESIVFDSL
ncbi:MAG: hypothetical protein Tsb0014_35020 [Pleurocapsa sp.]